MQHPDYVAMGIDVMFILASVLGIVFRSQDKRDVAFLVIIALLALSNFTALLNQAIPNG